MSTPSLSGEQRALIEALQSRAPYPHPVDKVELIETHISWIMLAGEYAYKLKKGLNLGFLDYETLESRKHFCDEELRINQRTAPTLYLAVVPITGTLEAPIVGGRGKVLEWAVKMRRFGQQQLAAHLLESGSLTLEQIDHLATTVAKFHLKARQADPASELGSIEAIQGPIVENFCQIREQLNAPTTTTVLHQLEGWYQRQFETLTPLLEQRHEQGFIRECHGDLHLDNIVLLDESLVPFDGIEFNDKLRFVDVVSDLAFLLMDLDYRGHRELSWRLLDGYLQASGDYAGMALLRFYQVYRAMVRAKVTAIRANQYGLNTAQHDAALATVARYLRLALHYTRQPTPSLVITHGFSGSGKSSVALALLQQWGAIRLRSDVERKRMFDLDAGQRSDSSISGGIYTASATRHTYQQLAYLSALLLGSRFNVIVDATFLDQEERQRFIALANKLGIRWYILDVTASLTTLRERIILRQTAGNDASEANLAVLDHQRQHDSPFTTQEQEHLLTLATDNEWSIDTIMATLR